MAECSTSRDRWEKKHKGDMKADRMRKAKRRKKFKNSKYRGSSPRQRIVQQLCLMSLHL